MAVKKIQKRLFGTNGVRGIVGKEITPELALNIGQLSERCDQEISQSAGTPGQPPGSYQCAHCGTSC